MGKDISVIVKKSQPVDVSVKEKKIDVGGKVTAPHQHAHKNLSGLDYENAEHTGFQKQLEWDEDYKCYLIEKE